MKSVSSKDRAHFERVGAALAALHEGDRERCAREPPGDKILRALRWSDDLACERDYPTAELDAQGTLLARWLRLRDR